MATYYVSTTGSNGAAGTEAAPWATLTFACASAANNDTINVAPGLYAEAAVVIGVTGLTINGRGAIIYGGSQVAGTWVAHAANVWKITTVAVDPVGIILRSSAAATYGAFAKGLKMDSIAEVNADRKWYWDSGTTTLYLYSPTTPATAYYRVDYAAQAGTTGLYAGSGGVYALGADNLTVNNLCVYGYRSIGFALDDTDGSTFNDCDVSFNCEDGLGGFNMPNFTVRGGRYCWNGTRKARSLIEILPDGDGISTHTGGAGTGSDGFSIVGVYFEGNTKSAVQNIHDSAGTIDRCISINCQLHFPLSSYVTSPQTCQNSKMIVSADDIGCFGADAGCVGTYRNCTAYGSDTVGMSAVLILNGTINMQNCIIERFDIGATIFVGTLNRNDNIWFDVTTLGFVLGGSELSSDPLLLGKAGGFLAIPRTSPAVGIGTDYSGSGSTRDLAGKTRPAAPSAGAYEPITAGGSGLGVGRSFWSLLLE